MSKPTQKQLAERYHVTPPLVSQMKKDGVDIYDQAEVVRTILNRRSRPPAWANGVPWEEEEKGSRVQLREGNRDLFQELEDADPNDYNLTRTLKSQIDAKHKLRQTEILEGDYIHRDEVTNDLTRIGSAVAAAHKQCQADLPAMLEGLSAAEAKKKIRGYMLKIDAMLADETSKLYQS